MRSLNRGSFRASPTHKFKLDRALGNLIYRDEINSPNQIEIIPIDFDYTLPEIEKNIGMDNTSLKISWLYFPQMDEPLTEDAHQYLEGMDINFETGLLNKIRLSNQTQCLYNMSFWTWTIGAEKNLTCGQILDFLDSEDFKSLYLQQIMEEQSWDYELDELISKRKQNCIDYLKNSIENYITNLEETQRGYPQDEKIDFDKAVYQIQDYMFEKNFRLAFGLMRKIIQAEASPEVYESGIKILKQYSGLDRDKMYAGFVTLIYILEEKNKQKEANELKEWVNKELD